MDFDVFDLLVSIVVGGSFGYLYSQMRIRKKEVENLTKSIEHLTKLVTEAQVSIAQRPNYPYLEKAISDSKEGICKWLRNECDISQ